MVERPLEAVQPVWLCCTLFKMQLTLILHLRSSLCVTHSAHD